MLVMTGASSATTLIDLMETHLAGAPHRVTEVIGNPGTEVVAQMVAHDFVHQSVVLMASDISEADSLDDDPRISDATEADLREWQRASTLTWIPDADESTLNDLVNRRELLDAGSTAVRLAARVDNTVVGSVDVVARGPMAEIDSLAVHTDHQRSGIGEALLTSAIARAHALGVRTVMLSALSEDWPREWYARRGFAEVGEVHSFTRMLGTG